MKGARLQVETGFRFQKATDYYRNPVSFSVSTVGTKGKTGLITTVHAWINNSGTREPSRQAAMKKTGSYNAACQ